MATTPSTTGKTAHRPTRQASTKTAAKAPAKAPTKVPVKAKTPVKPEAQKTPSKAPKAAPAPKEKKLKVVRDSYTIPKAEYAQLGELKKRALALGLSAKKSEVLRAGLMLLSQQSDTQLKSSLSKVPAIKTGRPAKA